MKKCPRACCCHRREFCEPCQDGQGSNKPSECAACRPGREPPPRARRNRSSHAPPEGTAYDVAAVLRDHTKRRAFRAGARFDLDWDWFSRRLRAGICEVTGLRLERPAPGVPDQACSPWAATVDLADSNGDYIEGNARMVVRIYHNAKGTYRDDDVDRMTLAHAEIVRERGWIASLGPLRRPRKQPHTP